MRDAIEPVTPLSVREAAGLKDTPAFARMAIALLTRLRVGTLNLVTPDGRRMSFKGQEPGPHADLEIRNWRAIRRLMIGGNVGWAEAFLDGDWTSADIASLLNLVSQNTNELRDIFQANLLARTFNRVVHGLRANTRAGARKNIYAHYDLGNEFYARWLDPTMTYSSARFAAPHEDLSHAQENKYRSLAELMDLGPTHRVLEIGSGWGGFAEFAAREIGCAVTGITISPAQLEYAQKRIFKAGLADRVSFRLIDYRDVDGHFDRIASIEMFEAVGERYWPAYFRQVHDRLAPGGRAGLQIITIADEYFPIYRRSVDFIQRYIFPGGMLPSMSALKREIAAAGLEWRDHVGFGTDYARTLACWRDSFIEAWDDIRSLGFDERFRRLWTYYLSYCEAGFRSGATDVIQVAASRN
ncbi:MAG: methyltransferase domain-containing protein [Alphaproteobacteria bacterium]|nr:methyltransferase domain-containing protein [Alphaproteobacteria bacterium]